MTPFLAAKSALEQRRHSTEARDMLQRLLVDGALASCHIVALEVLYSARNLADYDTLLADIKALPWFEVTTKAMDRAGEVQHLLAEQGKHRLPIPDLIAGVTGQATRWIVPRGSGG